MGPVTTHDEIADVATAIDGMLDRLEVSFAAQRRFVHDASHELRTPLTIARGHLEVAQPPGDASPELQAAVGVAIDELDRMGRLVDNLLRLARADEGTDHKRTPVDVALLADDLVQRSLVLGDRDWQVHAPTEAIVDGDEDALNEVLLNLVSNAVRHTSQADTIDIRVAIRGDRVTVEVADTGDGIDPELLPTLFDRFTRADSARSRDTGGAGLGLAICRAIVEAHGGTITSRKHPGERSHVHNRPATVTRTTPPTRRRGRPRGCVADENPGHRRGSARHRRDFGSDAEELTSKNGLTARSPAAHCRILRCGLGARHPSRTKEEGSDWQLIRRFCGVRGWHTRRRRRIRRKA